MVQVSDGGLRIGDIRSEVLKELERQVSQLAPFRSRPGVDKARLDALLDRVSAMAWRLVQPQR